MNWQAFGTSVPGVGHRRLNLPCQDACKWQVLPHGVVCAVADGLGSVARADVGAALAVDAVVQTIANLQPEAEAIQLMDTKVIKDKLRKSMQAARTALVNLAVNASVHDYATTLLVAWVTDTWSAVAQIGDGAIVGCWPDGRLEALSLPQQGEYVNETIPLTAVDAMNRLYINSWPERLAAVALFSDGLQSLAVNLQRGVPYAPFFTPLFNAVRQPLLDSAAASTQLAAFLASERVCAKTDDDKTLVIAGYSEV